MCFEGCICNNETCLEQFREIKYTLNLWALRQIIHSFETWLILLVHLNLLFYHRILIYGWYQSFDAWIIIIENFDGWSPSTISYFHCSFFADTWYKSHHGWLEYLSLSLAEQLFYSDSDRLLRVFKTVKNSRDIEYSCLLKELLTMLSNKKEYTIITANLDIIGAVFFIKVSRVFNAFYKTRELFS